MGYEWDIIHGPWNIDGIFMGTVYGIPSGVIKDG
jgi:hypothetical protein